MEVENWLPVKDYEGLYEVSDLGRVKSLKFGEGKILKQYLSSSTYLTVKLYKDGKKRSYSVHTLVAVSFLNHISGRCFGVVNHINFNRHDNRLVNLELVSARENANLKHLPSTSKYVGVHFNKERGKWKASIFINKKSKFLGRFDSELEAHYAYQKALAEISQ